MRTHLILLTLMLILLSTLSMKASAEQSKRNDPVPKSPTAEELFKEGRQALFQGEYDRAIDLLKKAVGQDSAKTSYRLYLARTYRYAKKDDQAQKLLADILKTAPDHVEAGQLLAEIYAGNEKWKSVVEVLEPLLQYRHDYSTYHYLAEAHYNLDDYKKARKYFEKATKLNPKNGSDFYQLGNIYLTGKLFARAAESYNAALQLGLESPVLHYKLASSYFNLRNYFGRIAVVTVKAGKVGTLNKNWYLIESVPGKKDTFRAAPKESAVYQLAKALDSELKERSDIHFLLANTYLNAHRYQQAYDMFKKIKTKIPKEDKSLYYYYYAQSAYGVQKYTEYLELLQEAIKLDKTTYQSALVDAYMKVADRYNQSGDLAKYIQYLALAVNQSPETASLHLKLGHAYEESQKYTQALAQWRMVLDLEPEHPQRMTLINLITKYQNQSAN